MRENYAVTIGGKEKGVILINEHGHCIIMRDLSTLLAASNAGLIGIRLGQF